MAISNIFISHSSRDAEQAERLLTWLHANGFTETFLDFDKHVGIAPGANWERTLYREVAAAEAVIVVLTKNWLDSKWCFAEFTQARALGKPIFPLIEEPAGESRLSPDIQHLDLVKDREGGLARLADELNILVLNGRGGFHWDNTRPPYPGLLAFDEADAAVYFGRDDDVHQLIELLNARRVQGGAKLLVVLGASGSGKSSLLRAGLLPRIQFDKRNWITLPPFRPRFHPVDELAQAVAGSPGADPDWEHWRDVFATKDRTQAFSDLARDLRATRGGNEAQILITIDQAEELFGTSDETEAENFLEIIDDLMDEQLPFLVVMALRSDYLGKLQDRRALTVKTEEFSLKTVPPARVRDIIEGPARVAGLIVDPDLVEDAREDIETDDALPLLALALHEVYDLCRDSGRLTLKAYKALGDDAEHLSPLENVVRRKAEGVLGAKPTPEDEQALKDAFVPRMVRVNAEGEYVRRPALLDEIPEKSRPLVEKLVKARLLVIEQDAKGPTVEVAHEALLRKWRRLHELLDEEREFLIGEDQLEQDLRDWKNAADDQKNNALLSGLKLTRAEAWLADRPKQLSEGERKFIEASTIQHEEEEERKKRNRRRWQQVKGYGSLVLCVIATVAIWGWVRATMNQARADKNFQLAKNTLRGMLEAVQPEPGTVVENVPQVTQLRVQLAEIAGKLYDDLTKEKPGSKDLDEEMAVGFEGLGDTNRLSGNYQDAEKYYNQAIDKFKGLANRFPGEAKYKEEMANSFDSMGLAYVSLDSTSKDSVNAKDAANAFDSALHLQGDLVGESPGNDYQLEHARTYYNRGILRDNAGHFADSESDYKKAIELLSSLVKADSNSVTSQELARAYNDLGNVLDDESHFQDARVNFDQAIQIDTELMEKEPLNRDIKLELAIFKNNLAIFLHDHGDWSTANDKNREALELIEYLAMPAPSLALRLADGHNIRSQILRKMQRLPEAEKESQESMDLLKKVKAMAGSDPNDFSSKLTDLAYGYLDLAEMRQKNGALAEAQSDSMKLSSLLSEVPKPDRSKISQKCEQFRLKACIDK